MEGRDGQISLMRELPPKTILIVEQKEALAQLLVYIISLATSYYPLLASDAHQALAIVEQEPVDLFVLNDDPSYEPNGMDLYEQLHRIPNLEHVPAIMIGATLPQKQIPLGTLVGLSKPFTINDLLVRLHRLLT